MAFSTVDLPAPLGPISAVTAPLGMWKVASVDARRGRCSPRVTAVAVTAEICE